MARSHCGEYRMRDLLQPYLENIIYCRDDGPWKRVGYNVSCSNNYAKEQKLVVRMKSLKRTIFKADASTGNDKGLPLTMKMRWLRRNGEKVHWR